MIRICHLAKYYAPFRGGIETHVQSLAKAQAAAGAEVTVVCINHQDQFGKDVWGSRFARTPRISEKDHGVKVERFSKFATFARFDFCSGLTEFLNQAGGSFDLLHLHVPNPTLCCALALADSRIPLVVTYHSDIVKQRFTRMPFRVVENKVFSRALCFIASSSNYADSSLVLKPRAGRVKTVPFGLDLQPYQNPSLEACSFRDSLLSEAEGLPLWLCVGRLVYYKGTEYAIRALPKCRGKLLLVGSGPLRTKLESLAKNLGVADRIIWRNHLSDDELIGAYHAATAFWFPSIARSEAFGLVQVEAMASGCPVINTQIKGSGVPFVSLDGMSGFTVDVANPDAIAEAANKLDHDSGLRCFLSQGARDRATRLFSLTKMVEETSDVYQAVLRSHNDRPSALDIVGSAGS